MVPGGDQYKAKFLQLGKDWSRRLIQRRIAAQRQIYLDAEESGLAEWTLDGKEVPFAEILQSLERLEKQLLAESEAHWSDQQEKKP